MLRFLANILEQLDVALDHLTKCDANNSRFALMLTDNVVEIMLHQIAKDKRTSLKMYRYKRETYEHTVALEKALGQNFEPKVKFAKIIAVARGRNPNRTASTPLPVSALKPHAAEAAH